MGKQKNTTTQYFWAFMVLALLVGGTIGFTLSNATTTGQAMNLNGCKAFATKCMDNAEGMNENQQKVCDQKILGCTLEDGFSEWFIENYGDKVMVIKPKTVYETMQTFDKGGVAEVSCNPGMCYCNRAGTECFLCRTGGTLDPTSMGAGC